MNIIKEWENRLQQVKQNISDYESILTQDITKDMKVFCLNEIQSKTRYKNLITETLNQLKNN